MNEIEKKQTTALAKIGDAIKGAVVSSENRLLHRRLRAIEIAFAVAFILAGLIIWRLAGEINRENRRTTAELTFIKDGFKLKDCGPIERKEKFRKHALRIFSVYGYRYTRKHPKAMDMNQKLAVIDLILEASDMMNFSPYDVLAIGILETALNPNAQGKYGEWGYLQQKEGTARFAERMLQLMPDRFRRKLAFRINDPEDLLDPITATKVAFVLLYTFRRDFRGREEWYVSIYHWGGFLSRYWHGGNGDIPKLFTINGIKYDVYAYYASFRTLKDCFEAGELEPGRAIVQHYRRKTSRLLKEEVQLHEATKVIQGLRRTVASRDKTVAELVEKDKDLQKHVRRAERDIRRIYGIAKVGKVSRIQATLQKAKGPVKILLRRIEKDDTAKFVSILVGAGLVALLFLAGFGYGAFRFVQYLIKRLRWWKT